MIDVSGATYPIKTNRQIREAYSSKLNAVYMDVHDLPSKPQTDMWHNFVECDGELHRIARMPYARYCNAVCVCRIMLLLLLYIS